MFKIVPDNFIEPATLGLEGRCSIQMSYGRSTNWFLSTEKKQCFKSGEDKEITKYLLYFALRAVLRTLQIAPGNLFELSRSHLSLSIPLN